MPNDSNVVYEWTSKRELLKDEMTISIGKARGVILCKTRYLNSDAQPDIVNIWLEFDELRKMVDAMDKRLKELGK